MVKDKDNERKRSADDEKAGKAKVEANWPWTPKLLDPVIVLARLLQEPKIAAKCPENCGCNPTCGCESNGGCCQNKCPAENKGFSDFPDTIALSKHPKFIELVGKLGTPELGTVSGFTKIVDQFAAEMPK